MRGTAVYVCVLCFKCICVLCVVRVCVSKFSASVVNKRSFQIVFRSVECLFLIFKFSSMKWMKSDRIQRIGFHVDMLELTCLFCLIFSSFLVYFFFYFPPWPNQIYKFQSKSTDFFLNRCSICHFIHHWNFISMYRDCMSNFM